MKPSLDEALADLPNGPQHDCSYLADLQAQHQYFYWHKEQGLLPGDFYQQLMDRHFRRSGRMFYRPSCVGCTRCISIRMGVGDFIASRSQRRVLGKNSDLTVRWGPPALDASRLALYQRYAVERHGGERPSEASTHEFLYDSPTATIEASYWMGERLVGVGICDLTPSALSTVYFYFDPDEQVRSLGVFSALQEIAYARSLGLRFYYLGYWVKGCAKMEYKAGLGNHELLGKSGWLETARNISSHKG